MKMTNATKISSSSWQLYQNFWRLWHALINVGEHDLAEELKNPIKTFWVYSVLSDSSTSSTNLTVVGPQGVGKSTMVNNLLKLPDKVALPVGEGSCEHIPIVLIPAIKDPRQVIVYKWTKTFSENQFYDIDKLSYNEGKERAIQTKEDDAIMFWYVRDNDMLKQIEPLIVLPGLELKAPWADSIKYVLDLSDIVLYTVDYRRLAQATSKAIEKWIEDSDLSTDPIVIVTKSDVMNDKQKNGLKKTIGSYSPLFIGTGTNKEDQYEFLCEEISKTLPTIPPRARYVKLKKMLLKMNNTIMKIDKIVSDRESSEVIKESFIIESVIKKLDEQWESAIRTIIIDKLDKELAERGNDALNAAHRTREQLFDGSKNKIKLWYRGGPTVKNMIQLENVIKGAFFQGLNDKLTQSITLSLEEKNGIVDARKTDDDDWTAQAMTKILVTAPPSVQQNMASLRQSMTDAGKLSQEMSKFIQGRVKDSKDLSETFKKLIITNKPVSSLAIHGSVATVGAAEAASEAVGAGLVTGTTASVIAGIAGGVIAVVAGAALVASILRGTHKMEHEVEGYTRECTKQMSHQIKSIFSQRLDSYWSVLRFKTREYLREQMGYNDNLNNSIFISVALKEAKDSLNDAQKYLF